jgi:hypothetical protein
MHNTYFLQVQTLISHKVIEVPELKNFAGSFSNDRKRLKY